VIDDRSTVRPAAHRIDPHAAETLDVLGPTVQILTPPTGDDRSPCLIRGTIPPGVSVPLHSHAEPETFLAISGRIEGLTEGPDGFRWIPIGPGDVFHIPGNARHAWRNRSDGPAVNMICTTERIARFFREVGTAVEPGRAAGGSSAPAPPAPEAIAHFVAVAERYGHWLGTPEENAALGLSMPTVHV
jgi:quercetin dioxygenase-like cupin family protein